MTIFTGFSPNLTGRDVLKALGWLCLPWKWRNLASGKNAAKVEDELEGYFKVKKAVTFDSGRTALHFALKALNARSGDEILVQAFTCMVVANAINWTGGKPIYVDVREDFNLDPDDLVKKITPKAKVIIIQHTFGLPAELEKIMTIAENHGLAVIEDCAHSFGARHNGRLTGTFGRIGMFSFGSDKIISCARGGALITDNETIGQRLKEFQSGLEALSTGNIVRHLLHYPVFYLGKRLYGILIGKALLWIAKRLYLMNKIITREEKRGEKDKLFGRLLPNALAGILLGQLKEADALNEHRKKISVLYDSELFRDKSSGNIKNPLARANNKNESVYLRYPILLDDPGRLLKQAKHNNIILGDWYNAAIAPKDSKMGQSGYLPGSCPRAENLASRIVNLPTDRNIDEDKARKVIKVVSKFIK